MLKGAKKWMDGLGTSGLGQPRGSEFPSFPYCLPHIPGFDPADRRFQPGVTNRRRQKRCKESLFLLAKESGKGWPKRKTSTQSNCGFSRTEWWTNPSISSPVKQARDRAFASGSYMELSLHPQQLTRRLKNMVEGGQVWGIWGVGWEWFSATLLHSSPVLSRSAGLSGELKLHAHVAAVSEWGSAKQG